MIDYNKRKIMKETRRQIVEQTRNKVAAYYKDIISQKDAIIEDNNKIINLQNRYIRNLLSKIDRQSNQITKLTQKPNIQNP